jgi:hypothetical protein
MIGLVRVGHGISPGKNHKPGKGKSFTGLGLEM